MNRPLGRHRDGFTLVELLVMVALLATLAAVVLGAVMRVRQAQDKSFSEATVSKVDSLLAQKLKTIQEQIKDRRKPVRGWDEAMTMTNQNPDIAEAVLMYAYTKNQLPMTFAEAVNPTVISVNGQGFSLLPSPVFTAAGLPAGTGVPEESAVCLYLALAPLGLAGMEQQVGDAPNVAGKKVFLDAYREPLYFSRLTFGGDAGAELDAPPYVKAPVASNTFDPFYPKQANGQYRNLATDIGVANANTLWAQVIPVTNANWPGVPLQYPGLRNHTAAVISAGPDKNLLVPGVFSGDNLLSYRLRKDGAKGD